MSIWEEIGSMIGQVQSLKDDVIQELTTDKEAIQTTVSDVTQDLKDSAASVSSTLQDATGTNDSSPLNDPSDDNS